MNHLFFASNFCVLGDREGPVRMHAGPTPNANAAMTERGGVLGRALLLLYLVGLLLRRDRPITLLDFSFLGGLAAYVGTSDRRHV